MLKCSRIGTLPVVTWTSAGETNVRIFQTKTDARVWAREMASQKHASNVHVGYAPVDGFFDDPEHDPVADSVAWKKALGEV